VAATTRAALYVRVSTTDQQTLNQLLELRRYVEARGWTIYKEYVDHGVSGAKDRRPALDAMLTDVRRRRADAVVVWSLDRLGRSLKGLVVLLADLEAMGVGVVSVKEGLDFTTPTGRLQAGLLALIAEFERSRIQERVKAGLARARAQGKRLGRPLVQVPTDKLARVRNLSVPQAATVLGVSCSTVKRWRRLAAAHQTSIPAA
jgi:DNA invertase Pin-like site-specific DNA recombinase